MYLIHPAHSIIYISQQEMNNPFDSLKIPNILSMDSTKLLHSFFSFLSTTIAIFLHLLTGLVQFTRVPIIFALVDAIISLHFRLHGLSPLTIDIDDQTTLHFWSSNHRRFNKPNLVMIHGYGGDARWQFIYQIATLSRKFNLYVPDLVFFGKSYSNRPDRSELFQAKCLAEGMKRLGVEKFSVFSISYGGFVAYRMADICPEEVEKVVIVSSGVGCSDDQIEELIKTVGRDPRELLLPKSPHDLRLLVDLSVHKYKPLRWHPDFFLQDFINVMGNNHRKEKLELMDHLLAKKPHRNLPILTQETLLIWGDKDKIFPLYLAYELQRHLGPKSRLEIIKDTGHAVNLDSPDTLNSLITSFVSDTTLSFEFS